MYYMNVKGKILMYEVKYEHLIIGFIDMETDRMRRDKALIDIVKHCIFIQNNKEKREQKI